MTHQGQLFEEASFCEAKAPKGQLLKWVGNKQRMAEQIVSQFPGQFGTYYEPFLGSGAVLATLAPKQGRGSDSFQPLMEIWFALKKEPEQLKEWYDERWNFLASGQKVERYEEIKASYNANPTGADLVFLCRSCYGGVVRFRKADGYMSTPCGVHNPISPKSFAWRVDLWHQRVGGVQFERSEYDRAMESATAGDLVYCDPPYSHTQAILYGAQDFSLKHLLEVVGRCKERGVYVALSIDGTKRSGDLICDLPIPKGLFERETLIDVGRSMLKRFQMNGKTLEEEKVADRLLLTY